MSHQFKINHFAKLFFAENCPAQVSLTVCWCLFTKTIIRRYRIGMHGQLSMSNVLKRGCTLMHFLSGGCSKVRQQLCNCLLMHALKMS